MRLPSAIVLLSITTGPLMAGDDYAKREFRVDNATLPYRLLRPAKVEEGKRYPLVIFLHGAGERGTDNEKQLVHGSTLFTRPESREKFPCFVLFPQCPDGKQWVQVPWGDKTPHKMPPEPSEPLRLVRRLLDSVATSEPVDKGRIYVMGLSMGGFGVWDFAARYPDVPAAVVPICGGADDSTAAKIRHVPAWVFHGARDTAVWPERSRSMVAALKQAGGTVRYTEYPTVGHDSWNHAFREAELLPWLFGRVRETHLP